MAKKKKSNSKPIKIHILGSSFLRKKVRKVGNITPKVLDIINDMWYILDLHRGAGLSAPQIGIDKQIIVINTGLPNQKTVLIDPVIVNKSPETDVDVEACLSLVIGKNVVRKKIERPSSVVVEATIENGKRMRISAGDNIFAKAIQHEVDHLNGILMVDYLPRDEAETILRDFDIAEDDPEWKKLDDESLRQKKKV